MSWAFNKNSACRFDYISLIFAVFLLLGSAVPVRGAEMVLNPALSVTVPAPQSGNPGQFLTYLLELNNHGAKPLNLQVEYLSEHRWNIIGDVAVSLPAHASKQYFPVTVFIPQNVPAGFEEKLRVRFKPLGETFPWPDLVLTARVNSVSAIHFDAPDSGKAVPGTTVHYAITVTNTGNTAEQFAVQARSAHGWPARLTPDAFPLAPGQNQIVRVELQVPGYTTFASDQLELTFRWGRETKVLNLTTFIVDQLDSLSSQYYIWQGYLHLGPPDLAQFNAGDTAAELALNGQWGPDRTLSLYGSNQSWFTDFQFDHWDLKAGQFPLTWPGLVAPPTGSASFQLSDRSGERYWALSRWAAADNSGRSIWGADAALDDRSNLRFLYDPLPGNPQQILEWHYQQDIAPNLFWTDTLSADVGDPSRNAGAFSLTGQREAWQWDTHLQFQQNFYNILNQKSLWATLSLAPAAARPAGYLQMRYESKQLNEGSSGINQYDDYQLQASAVLPSGLRLNLTHGRHWLNSAFDSDDTSLALGLTRQTGRFNHEGTISYSTDYQMGDGRSRYQSFDWYTRYQLSQADGLIINPNADSDLARLGLGYQRRWSFGPELTTLFYTYLQPDSKYNWTVDLSWPFYQYLLLFKYSGLWEAGAYRTDSCSISINKRFSFPVKKPLGSIAGTAFIDKNRDGLRQSNEPAAGNLSLLLDGRTACRTDSDGKLDLSGLSSGEHTLALDPRYNVIYLTDPAIRKITVKAYQTVTINLPVIRTQNLAGWVFRDKGAGSGAAPAQSGIAGVPVLLTDLISQATRRTYTDQDGRFVFYQLVPHAYQLTVDGADLPEGWQLPPDFQPIPVAADALERQEEIAIGLIPYEKPIEIIALPDAIISLTPEPSVVNRGQRVQISVAVNRPVRRATLRLPDGSLLALDPAQTHWQHSWRVPQTLAPGQYTIDCEMVTRTGKEIRETADLIVL